MNVLVVNIGSTSFKFRLYDMTDERVLVSGGVEGVGSATSKVTLQRDGGKSAVMERPVGDQADAVSWCLDSLGRDCDTGGHADSSSPGAAQAEARGSSLSAPLPEYTIDAVGFKAVHGGNIAGAVRVTADVIQVMEELTEAAPAHNPPYIAAMKAFEAQMPDTPLVAAFETGFHQTIPASRATYAIPYEWTTKHGVRRYGFHGASHRYVAMRAAELFGRDDLRVISCHLGGSSSICAIRAGESIATSLGMTPQSGVPQNNRVGDFDAYALLTLRARTGMDMDGLLAAMAREGGLLGISGVSNDMREIVKAALSGHERAGLALDVFVESIRGYIGAYLLALRGLDVLVFTGGIGERSAELRRRVCDGLAFIGVQLDPASNKTGGPEALISSDDSHVKILAMQTNEELIVARQTREVLTKQL